MTFPPPPQEKNSVMLNKMLKLESYYCIIKKGFQQLSQQKAIIMVELHFLPLRIKTSSSGKLRENTVNGDLGENRFHISLVPRLSKGRGGKESLVHTVCACVKLCTRLARAMTCYDVLVTSDRVLTPALIAIFESTASVLPSVLSESTSCVRTAWLQRRHKENC